MCPTILNALAESRPEVDDESADFESEADSLPVMQRLEENRVCLGSAVRDICEKSLRDHGSINCALGIVLFVAGTLLGSYMESQKHNPGRNSVAAAQQVAAHEQKTAENEPKKSQDVQRPADSRDLPFVPRKVVFESLVNESGIQ